MSLWNDVRCSSFGLDSDFWFRHSGLLFTPASLALSARRVSMRGGRMGCFSGICYMEVAVTHVTSSRIRALAITGIGALWITTLFGCADVITYSRDAQREGIKLYRQGDYADAAGAFRNALRQNPRDYQSYYYLGASYEAMTQYQQA